MKRYMYLLTFLDIRGKYRFHTTPRLTDLRKWRRSDEGKTAVAPEFRRISLGHYNDGRRVRRGEFNGWDLPTLRVCSEEFTP